MEALITKLLGYGTTPALLVLAFLVGWLIRKIDENGKRDDERATALSAKVAEQLKAQEARIEERQKTSDKRIDELSAKVSCIERDYLPREDHYKDISGWRTEINRLVDLIISMKGKD